MNPCSHYKQGRCLLHSWVCFDNENDDCLDYNPKPDSRFIDKLHQTEIERMETYGTAARRRKEFFP